MITEQDPTFLTVTALGTKVIRSARRIALAICIGSLTQIVAWAHGDVHLQIEELTPKIKQAPTAELHLKRGELHRLHEDYKAALADFAQAEKLDPELHTIFFARGRALFESGRLKPAKEALDYFIKKRPNHIEAHMVRGRVHTGLKDPEAAVKDYDRIVELTDKPSPDCFLERAEALMTLDRGDAALKSLDQGIERLGNLLALQKAAMDIELRFKRYDAALARVDRVMGGLQRKEVWQARRGEILDAAGRRDEANRAYSEALASMDLLSPHHRKTKPMRDLTAQVQARLGKDSTQDKTQQSTN